jgi:peptidoglycan/xylan/chitin deacetylase (PgdA/CDA1 family)
MYQCFRIAFAAILFAAPFSFAQAADCTDNPRTTGLSRIIAIDSSEGNYFGRLQYKQTAPLRKKEVILTFDDGPHRTHTREILDVLDQHCVKATFFTVGRMSFFMAKQLKEVARRGHTIASHSWSHPRALSKLTLEEAKVEIEKGFAATAYVLGQPIAPFFRYPGLNYSDELNTYLASRNITVWSVDVVSDDTQAGLTPEQLVDQAMERIRRMNGGIVLFHDLKEVTALAMDSFLTQLKLEGFKIVHVVSNTSYQPAPDLVAQLDFSRQSLRTVAFTGVAPIGMHDDDETIMSSGKVEYMKNEFIQIDADMQPASAN